MYFILVLAHLYVFYFSSSSYEYCSLGGLSNTRVPACSGRLTVSRVPVRRDSRLPDSLSAQERRQHAHEMERVNKWLAMLGDRDYERRHEQKWASRVRKGIPQRMRGRVWLRLLQVERQLERHSGLYAKLRHQARLWSPDARQIDLDVNRTFRDHTMFRERYGIKQQALFHVLGKLGRWGPAAGGGAGRKTCSRGREIVTGMIWRLSDTRHEGGFSLSP